MKENSLYDRKSLRTVTGNNPDFSELAKDCVAFSNAEGGVIDIGIENGDSMPPAGQTISEELPTVIVNKIKGLTDALSLTAEIIKADNGAECIRLHVPRSSAVSVTSSGKIYIRIGDNSMPVGSEDITRLLEDKATVRWEDMPTPYDWQSADEDKVSDLIRRLRSSDRVSAFVKQKETKEMLDYYFLTEPDSGCLTNLGVLFIGSQTQRGRLSNTLVVQCIKYDQYGDKVNKWLWDDYTKSPYEIISDIWSTVPEWKECSEIPDGLFRWNIPAYPESVVRELLANAFVHRSYTIKGDVFINIYPDFMEVVNPGRLPLGVTADNILHTSKQRNEHFAKLFYDLHLKEREGSGYDMIYETLLANGKAVPTVSEGDDWVKVRVKRKIVNQEMIKVMRRAHQEYSLKQKQLICLGLITLGESLSGSQLIKELHLNGSDELRSWLNLLLDKGLVVTSGANTKAKQYRVNPQLLKDSNYKGRTSLIRIEDYRIRELIVEDLKIYKEASSMEIQSRIGNEIPLKRIWRQLHILISEGRVKPVGNNRWRRYALVV